MPGPAQLYPVFKPAMRVVTAITNGFPCMVTTSFDHGYVNGTTLRLKVPLGYGMTEANNLFGSIIVNGTDTFYLDVDTTHFTPFVIPSTAPYNLQSSQCVPFGELTNTLKASLVNVLPFNL